ncbi:MAG: hypothetical protein JWM86_543, partial [Thermoleophilia bacterium]|nr:hypothetical protein [Thermoleophilia bacterium]
MDPFTAVDDQLPTAPDREDELSCGEAVLLAAQVFDARPVTSRTSRRFEPTPVPAPSTKVLIVSHDPER